MQVVLHYPVNDLHASLTSQGTQGNIERQHPMAKGQHPVIKRQQRMIKGQQQKLTSEGSIKRRQQKVTSKASM